MWSVQLFEWSTNFSIHLRILILLVFWPNTYSQELLLNVIVFVDVAALAKLANQMALIFLQCYNLYVGRLDTAVQSGADYLLVVHRLKKVGNH